MIEIFRAGSQLIKVRFLMLLFLAVALGAIVAGWGISQYMTNEAGDALAPPAARYAMAAAIIVTFVGIAAAMWLYGRRYIASAAVDEAGGRMLIRTVEFFGARTLDVPLAALGAGREHAGQLDLPDAPSVNAPWVSVPIAGHRFSFIIDMQGDVLDRARARRYLGV